MNHRMTWRAYSMLVFCLLLPAQSACAAFFVPLGDLPGGEFSSTADDVSADGSVVVGSSAARERQTIFGWEAFDVFRWTSADGMIGLGAPAIVGETSVSADGSTVVGCCSSQGWFRWTQDGGMVGYGNGSPHDVSADGAVVVGQGNGGNEAFRWTVADGLVGLGVLPGYFGSFASGVSSDGSVVVGASYANVERDNPEAFRWTSANGMIGLGDLSGGQFESRAHGVSADGSVVVGYGYSASGQEAFRWTIGQGMVGLGDLSGGSFGSSASDISADGAVIVGWGNSASGFEAFVWDATHGMRSLSDVLSGLDVDLTGWTLTNASAISADATTIVGSGINPTGYREAWVANISTVPEPSTASIALVGVTMLAAVCGNICHRRQRR